MSIHPRFTVSIRLDLCRAPGCLELTRRIYVDAENGPAYRACCLEHAEDAARRQAQNAEQSRAARISNLMAPWEQKGEFE